MADSSGLNHVLENARRELLDLTTRNRLLHTPRNWTRSTRLEIVDEVSDEVYRRLVIQGKAMSFLARLDEKDQEGEASDEILLSQPEEDTPVGDVNTSDDDKLVEAPAPRHVDDQLQTELISERLQKRLLQLFYDARTFEEEQGVNILYLAIGYLRWYEDDNSDRERFAPLLLVPVQLDRPNAHSRFKLRYSGDEITTNLSLQARLKADFGIELPDVPDSEEMLPSDYLAQVREVVRMKNRWEVLADDMVLWFFSFAKFLMYRDLDPTSWPTDRQLQDHGLTRSLLAEGFRGEPPLCGDEENIDRHIAPIDYETLVREVFRRHPELARFHGGSHEQLQARFRELDLARIELARQEVAAAHYQRLPMAGAQVGEIGVIRREIQKKRRHLPLRRLLSQAGRAVQAIKPVFMMSPISVAQYLEPGGLEFDLLLVDEASQVQPVDALGAIARCKQLVVVGDSRQLPPTRFFSRLLDDEAFEDSDEGALKAGDMESILGLCCAQNVPQRMLSWHYRSRHHSLIAVSNREFYDNRLYVIPSPGQPGPGQGLLFVHVPDGLFDRGGSASNPREAQVVAQAVMEHARNSPDQSLGVGTFSVAQRDAILNELELLRRADVSCETFFAGGVSEPFFVKNLENIQGDERDVILISVGYGRNADGYMAMNFGPLSNEGGERRLNVLITRARESCRVYSSITANDIDLQRARARGAAALKTFLTYAETGLLETGPPTGREHDSEFERQVALALTQHGFHVEPQVGVAGFYIDLAVQDPDLPGRYLLGIECDGANYHRSRSARDRDRLRQAVLENRGWKIHRIWSTDWFQRPEDELRKVLGAIEQARMSWANHETDRIVSDSPERITEAPPPENPTIAREVHRDLEATSEGTYPTRPYEVASFRISRGRSLQQLRPPELAKIVTRVVQIEGPIHREEIIRRVTQLGGLQRTGRRVREAVEAALEKAAQERLREEDTNFFMVNDIQDVPIRDRGVVPSSSLRKPDMLPPAEIRQAMLAVVRVHFGVAHDEAIIETARLFGYRSTSPQLREVLERELGQLLSQGELEERNGRVYLA